MRTSAADTRDAAAGPAAPRPHGIPFGEAVRTWARVAALSFGGPAGQIAVMHRILVEEKRWIGEARFRFVPPKGYVPEPGELRFDMFEAEFTHEGDRCTFEVLLGRAGPDDPALRAIAELVHDLDLKDGRFGRPETAGFGALVEGLCAATGDDAERLARGAALLDDLHAYFARRRR